MVYLQALSMFLIQAFWLSIFHFKFISNHRLSFFHNYQKVVCAVLPIPCMDRLCP